MRTILFLLLFVFTPVLAGAQAPAKKKAAQENAFALVEFYTSDSCIRCRDATKVVAELDQEAREKDRKIFLISFHIDYLNDTWKDQLSRLDYTERQKTYAKQFRQRKAIPGSIVVNGRHYVQGDEPDSIRAAIAAEFARKPKAQIKPLVRRSANRKTLTIEYKINGIQRMRRPFFNVGIAVIEPKTKQLVGSGNNANYEFTHVNSVVTYETQRAQADGLGSLDLTLPESVTGDDLEVVIFVTDPQDNGILGATRAWIEDAAQ